jgi:hypothetical protein
VFCTCVIPGRGIIRTADEGPTTAIMNRSADVDKMKTILGRNLNLYLARKERRKNLMTKDKIAGVPVQLLQVHLMADIH